MSLIGNILHYFFERSGRKLDYAALHARLQESGEVIAGRLAQAADTPANREAACHVIGIERWGQHRLRSALSGEPPVMDEYDSYRPAQDADMKSLHTAFQQARADTLALVTELQNAAGLEGKTIPHNEFGETSVRGWLVYLDAHSTRESQKIK